jgi:hypothetical protein
LLSKKRRTGAGWSFDLPQVLAGARTAAAWAGIPKVPVSGNSAAGNAGQLYGGGGGVDNGAVATPAGGAGARGVVYITEYSNQ